MGCTASAAHACESYLPLVTIQDTSALRSFPVTRFSSRNIIVCLSQIDRKFLLTILLRDTHPSSRTLFVRMCVHVTSNVELRNNVRLLLNVELRNYVISRQIVERRVTSECYLNIVVSLDC